MLDIRKAAIEDLYKVRRIAQATWHDTFGSMLSEKQISYMLELMYNDNALRQQVSRGHHFILAYWDDEAVGFMSYEINYNGRPQLMLHKLYLLPNIQGLGIGTKMLNFLAGIAVKEKNDTVRLKVFHKNAKAFAFYEKYGFIKTGEEMTDLGNNFSITDYIMEKELPPSGN